MKKSTLEKLRRKPATIRPAPGQESVETSYGTAIDAAQKHLNEGNHVAAENILRQLSSQFKKESQPLLGLLTTFMQHRRFDDALTLSQKLLKAFPTQPSVLVQVAMLYHLLENSGKALELAQRAQRIAPGNPQALEMLATIYQGLGDREKALRYFDLAVQSAPNNPILLFGKARAMGSPAPAEFVSHLESLTTRPGMAVLDKAHLHYALAWAHEKSDVETHFHHLEQANTLVSRERPWNPQPMEAIVKRNRQLFSEATVRRFQRQGDSEYRPIFIASMPRSGTTLLENMVGAHSTAVPVGESGAMDNALGLTRFRASPLGGSAIFEELTDYRAAITSVGNHFREAQVIAAANGMRIVDKTISNYFLAGIILMAFPRARIIHLQRHPLDVIYSCFQQHFAAGYNYTYSLEALASVSQIFSDQMAFWTRLFPESVHTVRYEDIVAEPRSALTGILEFCELPWEDACLDYQASIGTITTASDQQVRQPLYASSVNKWRRIDPWLAKTREVLGDLADYPV